ncbi:MAG TPA: DEAD/DEAH box helicase [Polyangiales bacterium]|nr:DEAD/DEAH box helicase [Polyangiales bacterium]
MSLELFSLPVRTWFERKFPHGPTPAQLQGWPEIAAERHTLIAAPTGSGKTLSAFLVWIDRLYRAAVSGELEGAGTQLVYVSPLKALAVDVHQNLELPLAEIAEVAAELGMPAPGIRVGVRTGDTPARSRAAMLKRPPHVLITTPESLYLLLTSRRSREGLAGVRSVIVDEIHALARDKRGAHLALTLERLAHVTQHGLVRIGLSATQRPIDRIARLLVGSAASSCSIVDTGHSRKLDLSIELPDSEMEAVASAEQVADVLDKIAAHVQQRRTTLVFVNTRRLSERLAHLLAERLGEDKVAAHHGSLSKERRQRVEERLRAGDLQAVVATASLELGIDIGPVELVCQIGSPRSIATLLQRVGRSGHTRFGTPVGKLYPLTRDELVECAALLRALRAGELDSITLPEAPLDILAQQIVAECAAEDWPEDGLFELMRGAAPYASLTREAFDDTLELVSEGVMTGRGRRAAYVQHDRVQSRLHARRGARLSALMSGGAIPEMADYRVIAEPDETFVGTVNEDFAIESMAGDVFLLGSTSWRIRRVSAGTVRVVDAKGAAPTVPFWLGEAPARTAELSAAVSALREALDAQLQAGEERDAVSWLMGEIGVDDVVARELLAYLAASREALGILPSQRQLVIERFFDDTGGMQLVVHAPFGGRINRALGLLMRKRFCTSFDFELQAAANDDAVVLSLGPQHSFALSDVPGFLRTGHVRESLTNAVIVTPMFGARWRWNLNRALVVLRYRGGKKNPPPLQRMEADDVMVAVFPALAACQDNATGPREIPDHVLVRQTLDDCMHEAMDLPALEALLAQIAAGEVTVHFRETTEPSPLAHEILNSRPYTFLDDAPLEERRTRAVQLRRGLPRLGRELAALDPGAIARVRAEAAPQPRDADELHDLLLWLGVLRPGAAWQGFFAELVGQQRALSLRSAGLELWCASERRAALEKLFAAASFEPNLQLPAAGEPEDPETTARELVRGHLEHLGPSTIQQLMAATGLEHDPIEAALAALEGQGFAMRGRFDPSEPSEQFCARRLLSRIHGYTQERLRREIEPVTPQDFMRFLLRFQHVQPGSQLSGTKGLSALIEQLQGFELAAAAWEKSVLAARMEVYRPEWLDALCLSGQVTWGRLELRSPRLLARPADDEQATPRALPNRATPLSLVIRADLPWLLEASRGATERNAPAECSPDTELVLAALRQYGALFLAQLAGYTALPESRVREALWEAVAEGLVTADGWQAMRSLLAPAAHGGGSIPARRSGLRRGARGAVANEGRWALLPPATAAADREELAEAVAEQLLARYGVVFRDLLARETLALPWRDVIWALRRLEDRGRVRGGRFVNGFVGEQFALPECVDLLRQVRRQPHDGQLVRLSGSDPLNLVGIIVPGPKVPALRNNQICYRDGAAVEDAPDAQRAVRDAVLGKLSAPASFKRGLAALPES